MIYMRSVVDYTTTAWHFKAAATMLQRRDRYGSLATIYNDSITHGEVTTKK